MCTNYPITIHHLYTSPGHNYFTHPLGTPGSHPTFDVEQITLHADQGIVGDRFYGRGPAFDGHVTFFSWEVYAQLQATLETMSKTMVVPPIALRRNVVLSGVPLLQLIGHEFTINGVRFRGAKHCAPCRWMDVAMGAGALAFLKGRGGLRAQVLSDGALKRGEATLTTSRTLDLTTVTDRLPRPRLP